VKDPQTEKTKSNLLPSLVILAFVIAYVVSGYFTLDETTRLVPLLAGIVTLLLLLLDMLSTKFSTDRRKESGRPEGGGVRVPAARGRELTAILFVAGGVAAVYLLGFLIAIPLYLFASIAFLGQQSPRLALIVTLIASLSIYVVFEVALAYELFPGVLFS